MTSSIDGSKKCCHNSTTAHYGAYLKAVQNTTSYYEREQDLQLIEKEEDKGIHFKDAGTHNKIELDKRATFTEATQEADQEREQGHDDEEEAEEQAVTDTLLSCSTREEHRDLYLFKRSDIMGNKKCEHCGVGMVSYRKKLHRHCKKAFEKGKEVEKKRSIELQKSAFNQGRKEADKKWQEAVDERVEELEKIAGIPELKKLKKDTKYKW